MKALLVATCERRAQAVWEPVIRAVIDKVATSILKSAAAEAELLVAQDVSSLRTIHRFLDTTSRKPGKREPFKLQSHSCL